MYNIVLIFLIILDANSLTQISLLVCPAQLNVTQINTTITTSASIRNFFYNAFQSQGYINTVQTIVITDDSSQQLPSYLVRLSIPYIIIALGSLTLFIILICFCLFEKSCPPCQSLQRDFFTKPYTKGQLKCVMIFGLIFSVLVMGTSIFSFIEIPYMKQDISYTKCGSYLVIDLALNGDLDNNWIGIIQLNNKIGNISALLSSASSQVSTYLPGDDWLVNDMSVMIKDNLQIYKKYKSAQLITSDPVSTANTLPGFSLPKIDSVFIKNGLGSQQKTGSMTNIINSGLKNTKIIADQAYAIDRASKQIVQSSSTVQANTMKTQNLLSMYQSQLNSTKDYLDVFSAKYFDDFFSTILFIIQLVIGAILAASFLIVIGIVSTYCFKIIQCRKMVHLGWVCYGFSHIATIFLVYLYLSVGSIGYQSCNYFEAMLSNQTSFNRLGDNDPQNVISRMSSCLYGDGNALKAFAINQQMQTVFDLFGNISLYFAYENSSHQSYVNRSISTNNINNWKNIITNYKLGIFQDSNDFQTADTNPNYAISRLNLYSNTGGGLPTCSKDRWVFDAANCTIPTQITYVTSTQGNGLTINNTNVICISFNQKISSTSSNPRWSVAQFEKRYVQIRNACPDAFNKITQYGTSLMNFRDSRINLYKSIQDDLDALLTVNTDFNSQMVNFKGRIDQFYSSISTLNNLVTNQVDGLQVAHNCQTLKNHIVFVYNSFCVNFMERYTYLGIASMILIFLMIGGIITGHQFAIRFARVQRDLRLGIGDISDISDQYTVKRIQKHDSEEQSDDD